MSFYCYLKDLSELARSSIFSRGSKEHFRMYYPLIRLQKPENKLQPRKGPQLRPIKSRIRCRVSKKLFVEAASKAKWSSKLHPCRSRLITITKLVGRHAVKVQLSTSTTSHNIVQFSPTRPLVQHSEVFRDLNIPDSATPTSTYTDRLPLYTVGDNFAHRTRGKRC